jgi:hypothetical protein
MTDKSRRNIRLASSRWFKLINYRDFNVYFTSDETLPQIVDRLLQYDGAVGLKIIKSKIKTLEGHMRHVSRLTHLTRLDLLLASEQVLSSTWAKFSTLTNLREYSLSNNRMPASVLVSLVNLREVTFDNNLTADTLINSVKKMSNLERIEIRIDCTQLDVYSLVSSPARLTRLYTHNDLDHSHTTKFYNLHELRCEQSRKDIPLQLALDRFTALETLDLTQKSLSFDALPTRLTSLAVGSKEIKQCSMDAMARLHNLQNLTVTALNTGDDRFGWLRGLTALDSFNLWPNYTGHQDEFDGSIFSHFNPNQLTDLTIRVGNNMKFNHLARLTALEELYFSEEYEVDKDYSFVSHLTRLTNFGLSCYGMRWSLSALTNLERMKVLQVESADYGIPAQFPPISLARMTNLEQLHIGDCSRVTLESLSTLEHLTPLHVSDLEPDMNYDFFEDLPLQKLECPTNSAVEVNFNHGLTKLTGLQSLQVWGLKTSQVVNLSTLQHLTCLSMSYCEVGWNGESITHLTSIQALCVVAGSLTKSRSALVESKLTNLISLTIL